jgi:hypothetical protein
MGSPIYFMESSNRLGDNDLMKKEALNTRDRRRTAKQRALLTLLDEMGRIQPQRDRALWAGFDRDLKSARLALRAAQNG